MRASTRALMVLDPDDSFSGPGKS